MEKENINENNGNRVGLEPTPSGNLEPLTSAHEGLLPVLSLAG